MRHLLHRAVGAPVLAWKQYCFRRFRDQAGRARQLQKETLEKCLGVVANSVYGKGLGLSRELPVAAFRRDIPIQTYDDLVQYIKAESEGERGALFSDARSLVAFSPTSGTTGSSKLLPVTRQSLADYRRSWEIWGVGVSAKYPHMPFSKILNLAATPNQGTTPGGILIAPMTGLLAALMYPLLRWNYVLPPSLLEVNDAQERLGRILAVALAHRDIRMINTANPATLIQLAEWLALCGATLVDEVAGQDRARGRELKSLLAADGKLLVNKVWPDISVIGVWTGGTLSAYLPRVKELFGEVPLRDHGLCATEGRLTIPLQDDDPCGVADFNAHFFEFIKESSYEAGQRETLLLHELELGETYYVILTSKNGLLRYDLQDVVTCRGYYFGTPMLAFLHKGSQVASITGEKLTAYQVAESLRQSVQEMSVSGLEFMLIPCYGTAGHYFLYVEAPGESTPHLQRFAEVLDQKLMLANIEYASKRRSGRLGGIVPKPVPSRLLSRWREQDRLSRGAALEQYKAPILLAKPAHVAAFQAFCEKEAYVA